ncbi:MAG: 16S rRNA (uracil(1498)-N(3))-methyltransferase [Planctomycetia bacterium]|nr:16S rRNA (uracil(1498)-N(3))-methyltransferase [Planctomycetia bacterium]
MADRFHIDFEIVPGPLVLRGPEAHHLHVSRVRVGDTIHLFHGDGREYPANVVEVTKRDVCLDVAAGETVDREASVRVVAACALPKGDRGQFLIEKLTELGVAEFVPILTTRTVVNPGESKLDKLRRYVIEASKQCGRNILMKVSEPRPWAEVLSDRHLPKVRLLAHVGETGRAVPGECAFAVGPEGGFTDAEVAAAQAAGWRTVGLGPRVLRVETAALVLASHVMT